MATAKVAALREAEAAILVVAPEPSAELAALAAAGKISLARRSFEAS